VLGLEGNSISSEPSLNIGTEWHRMERDRFLECNKCEDESEMVLTFWDAVGGTASVMEPQLSRRANGRALPNGSTDNSTAPLTTRETDDGVAHNTSLGRASATQPRRRTPQDNDRAYPLHLSSSWTVLCSFINMTLPSRFCTIYIVALGVSNLVHIDCLHRISCAKAVAPSGKMISRGRLQRYMLSVV